MPIAFISHQDCLQHDTGQGHPERPDRIKVIETAVKNNPDLDLIFLPAPKAKLTDIKAVHSADYVDWLLSSAPKDHLIGIDQDTIMSPGSLNAALRAAGAVISAVDLVMENKVTGVFCNVRPPGHHAEYEKAMGFCFFNNVAIGVIYAFKKYQLKRIAIIDFDAHHGNGTQNIFQHDKRVLYCSSFQHRLYPGYDQEQDNKHIISIALPEGGGGEKFYAEVREKWLPAIKAFNPELIFFSAGFDAHRLDPLTQLAFEKADYVWITEEIAKIAKVCCGGKMISVLEGGYSLDALAECVPAHIKAMADFG